MKHVLTLALVVILALVIVVAPASAQATKAAAAPAAPVATPATPTCTITGIIAGGVVVIGETLTAPITVGVRNCGTIESVTADKLVLDDVVSTPTRVTARVKAEADALVGPTSFKLVDDKGTETESPKATYILVLDKVTAGIRQDAKNAAATAAAAAAQIKTLKAEVTTAAAALNTTLATRPTTDEVKALLAPIATRITDLEKVTAQLLKNSAVNDARDEVLRKGVEDLATGQEALGNAMVKKGIFSGKKPLAPEIAEAAERIKRSVAK